jgi:hypothetical protein
MPEGYRQIIRERLAVYNANANAGRLWTAAQTSSGSCETVDLTNGTEACRSTSGCDNTGKNEGSEGMRLNSIYTQNAVGISTWR